MTGGGGSSIDARVASIAFCRADEADDEAAVAVEAAVVVVAVADAAAVVTAAVAGAVAVAAVVAGVLKIHTM